MNDPCRSVGTRHSATPEASLPPKGILRPTGLFVLGCYLIVSLLFMGVCFRTTYRWSSSDFDAFTHFEGYDPVFRLRILVPILARAISYVVRIDIKLIYQALAVLVTFGLLIAYQRYLANFLRPAFSSIFSLAVVYPMLWNFCLLTNGYLPFDLPSLLFFVMGCHFIYRRNWLAYYPTLALATLNRETACFLIFVFFFCLYAKMSKRTMFWHVFVQALLWGGLKYSTYVLLGSDSEPLFRLQASSNARVISDMLRLRGNALKDWAKLGLSFGGTWLVLPWVFRRQPAFLKRSLLVVVPIVTITGFCGIIDEIRVYSELVPILLTPLVYAVAAELGGAKGESQVHITGV
jgi:hypothetical protein